MKKNRMLVLFAAFGVVASAFYGGHEYFKPNPDMAYLKAAFRIETSALLQEFNFERFGRQQQIPRESDHCKRYNPGN